MALETGAGARSGAGVAIGVIDSGTFGAMGSSTGGADSAMGAGGAVVAASGASAWREGGRAAVGSTRRTVMGGGGRATKWLASPTSPATSKVTATLASRRARASPNSSGCQSEGAMGERSSALVAEGEFTIALAYYGRAIKSKGAA